MSEQDTAPAEERDLHGSGPHLDETGSQIPGAEGGRSTETERPSVASASEASPKPSKVDPETLAIRARPPQPTRVRKGMIVAGTAASLFVLGGVAWMAFSEKLKGSGQEVIDLSQPSRKPNDAVAALPASYGKVPKLGPPLPGDLGRPILRAQERGMIPVPSSAPVPGPDKDNDRERREVELGAALKSGLMVQNVRAAAGGLSSPDEAVSGLAASSPESARPESPEQDGKTRFAERLDERGNVNPHLLAPAPSANMLMAGSVIAGSLITGLNSDVPGMVVAQVTQNVFDSVTGQVLLIPQGARLIGNYDSLVAYGQSRALVVWQRLVMPDGQSLRFDNMPAADPSGNAGLTDQVSYHTGRLLKGVAIATLLGVGTELSISGESDLVQAIREAAQTNVSRAGDQITQRNLDIRPTITIRPGAAIRLLVRQDLILKPWTGRNEP